MRTTKLGTDCFVFYALWLVMILLAVVLVFLQKYARLFCRDCGYDKTEVSRMSILIGCVILVILLCAAAVAVRGAERREKRDGDTVYREHYRQAQQYRSEQDEEEP